MMKKPYNLDNIRFFCKQANNPEKLISNKVIHIAGTNGKGSVAAFLRFILEAQGYSVNVFTSPHLVSPRERIRLKGSLISPDQDHKLNEKINQYSSFKNLSWFEIYFAKALIAFSDYEADFVIIEAGLGGKLDATNIFTNVLASVITTISYDHIHILGNTLAKITRDKSGIIKQNSLCILGYQPYNNYNKLQNSQINKIVQAQCLVKNTKIVEGGVNWKVQDKSLYFEQNKAINLSNLGLKGDYQRYNAALAVSTILSIGIKVSKKACKIGLSKTFWPARLQLLGNKLYNTKFDKVDKIILDGCHNVQSMSSLATYINTYYQNYDIYFILGMVNSKDLYNCLFELKKANPRMIYGVSWSYDQELKSDYIVDQAIKLNINACKAQSVEFALSNIAKIIHDTKKLIVICGSLYLAGSVLSDNNILPD